MVQSHFYDPKAFIEYLLDMQGICKNIGEYDPKKKLIVFDFDCSNEQHNQQITNCYLSFIRYWLWRVKKDLQKMYYKTIFFLSSWYYSCVR